MIRERVEAIIQEEESRYVTADSMLEVYLEHLPERLTLAISTLEAAQMELCLALAEIETHAEPSIIGKCEEYEENEEDEVRKCVKTHLDSVYIASEFEVIARYDLMLLGKQLPHPSKKTTKGEYGPLRIFLERQMKDYPMICEVLFK